MQIAVQSSSSNNFINTINDEIERLLVNSTEYQEEKLNIFLIEKKDLDNLKTKLSSSNRDELNRSFMITFGNYDYLEKGIICHLVVINEELCDSLLNNEEQIAVTLHELGHILNEYEVSVIEYADYQRRMFQQSMKGINVGKILTLEEIKFQNECYADYYAKANGYAEHLKTSISKYIDDGYTKNKIELVKRISELCSDNILSGKIKRLNT